jgi:hypothetical protein
MYALRRLLGRADVSSDCRGRDHTIHGLALARPEIPFNEPVSGRSRTRSLPLSNRSQPCRHGYRKMPTRDSCAKPGLARPEFPCRLDRERWLIHIQIDTSPLGTRSPRRLPRWGIATQAPNGQVERLVEREAWRQPAFGVPLSNRSQPCKLVELFDQHSVSFVSVTHGMGQSK